MKRYTGICRRAGCWILLTLLAGLIVGCFKKGDATVSRKGKEMILDKLTEAEKYYYLHPAFAKAFAFLNQKGLSEMPAGRHEIEGERLFCIITKAPGKARETVKLEAHRKYIDIQYIIAGNDEMGWKATDSCAAVDQQYDPDKDIQFYKDTPVQWALVPAGSFAIFFPDDAHAPMVGNGEIHKVVIKIALERPGQFRN